MSPVALVPNRRLATLDLLCAGWVLLWAAVAIAVALELRGLAELSETVGRVGRALSETGLKRLVVAGGVGANRRIRATLSAMAASLGAQTFYPRPEFCTDNGAMIAYAGMVRLQAGQRDPLSIATRPRWPLTDLNNPTGVAYPLLPIFSSEPSSN